MAAPEIEVLRAYYSALTRGDIDAALELADEGVVVDMRNSLAPWRGIYRGREELRRSFVEVVEPWTELNWEIEHVRLGPGRWLVARTRIRGRGGGSGLEVDAAGSWLASLRDGRVAEGVLFQTFDEALGAARRRALEEARLYFVCDARPNGADPEPLLDAALRGGVDMIQLRDKDLDAEGLLAAAPAFRDAADRHRALFTLNDRPDLVGGADADGVHVGQEDVPVREARRDAGPEALVGLSTHSAAEVDAATAATGDDRPDQISVGPVWETPTKAGRPATGLGLIEHAARVADIPWFAIGGIDASNVGDVVAAGAERIVVVRAIRDAADPEAAARELQAALEARVGARS